MKHLLLILTIALSAAGTTDGAVLTADGSDPEFWHSHSLVYAVVSKVSHAGAGEYQVTIHPETTLTGVFDCEQHPEIELTLFAGEGSAILAPPEPDSKSLFLIREKEIKGDDGKFRLEFRVPSSVISFMPDDRPIAMVSGLEDSVVSQVLMNIEKAKTGGGEE